MASSSTRLRVRKLDLIREMRAARDAAIEAYEKAAADYPARLEAWQRDALKKLRQATRRVERGLPVDSVRTSGFYIPARPEKPTKKKFVCQIDADLSFVAKAEGDSISLSADDYGRLTRQVCR